jgi:bacterioferritin-associated ferredoxin
VYVCSCFGITEEQVHAHRESGACTPRQIASACKAGTDCGGCVRRIQALLGRGATPQRRYTTVPGSPALPEPARLPEPALVEAMTAAEASRPPAAAA